MRTAYLDCFSGAAGDMFVGALLDAGASLDEFHAVVARLALPAVGVSAERVKRGGIAATHFRVEVGPEARAKHRHLPQIHTIIDRADLPPRVAQRAKEVFGHLAQAEAQVHGTTPEKVHFHEVGAADAIVDIVLACYGVERLGLERLASSPVPTGSGTVLCEHGLMPVPAPATALLLRGLPLAPSREEQELTTPTGAALLRTLCAGFGPSPLARVEVIGYGAGTRENRTCANVLRIMIGDDAAGGDFETDRVTVFEAQLDDLPGQNVAYAVQALLEAGALDAYLTPVQMKKGRPGQLLTVLAPPDRAAALQQAIFAHTSTFGVRNYDCSRSKLRREVRSVQTRFGPIRLKVGQAGAIRRAWPEYEDCAAAARAAGVPLREVQEEALLIWKGTDAG